MAALSQGLRDDEFFRALALEPSPDDNLLGRASRFINLEEARQQKVEESHQALNPRSGETRKGKEPIPPRRDVTPGRNNVLDVKGPRYQSYQPLTTPLSNVLCAIEKRNDLRWPRFAREEPRRSPALGTFCRFHNEYGHTTDECSHLKDEVERLIRDNKIGDFVKIDPSRGQKREAQFANPTRVPPPPPMPKRGYIQMISGGPTGGDTHRARRRYLGDIKNKHEICQISAATYHKYPPISFGPEDAVDLDDFHCDPLLITINVGGYDVARAFVDSGSSVDVISYDCFRQMELDLPIFPVTTPIFGFTRGSLIPVGQVKIPVTIGTPPRTRTQTVNFVIVEGSHRDRPTNDAYLPGSLLFYTPKLKFPVDGAIGEVRGDQAQSRSCYVEMVKVAEKWRRGTLAKEDLGDEKRPRIDPEDKVTHVQPMDELLTIDLIPGTSKQTRISKELDLSFRDELVTLLRSNMDIFAWQPSDLTAGSPTPPGHRAYPGIQFPTWLSNAVLVQKANGQWRMCIDFRHLNKACPKDDYPLPRIDQLVDATVGCELLSMMDASQGYHQIPLEDKDQPAVSFITTTGTYCYVVMPFGLKNVGATYQRLMDKMFQAQLGRNIEVYVDDMLVKSKKRSTHLADLAETFATLRLYRMKLNPGKCAFGVKAGKFLGYVITQEGIKVNQDKVEAVLRMTPPRSIKEVQSLAGKMVALGRFISRMADKSLPFFKVLRKAAQFEWTDKCQLAFEALKTSLSRLPILSTPERNETLFVYLSVGDEAVSSVLFKEYQPRTSVKGLALVDFIRETIRIPIEKEWQVYVDGSSTVSGAGAGVIVIDPMGVELEFAIKLPRVLNNEAEYEAIIRGMEIAQELGAQVVRVHSDSQLGIHELGGEYEIKNDRMRSYVDKARNVREAFEKLTTVDARCLGKSEVEHYLDEVHRGGCGEHGGARTLMQKLHRAGYYWPDMKKDTHRYVRQCKKCQRFAPLIHKPGEEMIIMSAPCPFAQWGIDLVGHFPQTTGGKKFLTVALDYFTKWVEAEALSKISEDEVMHFIWKNICCRFGLPRSPVSDNGTQFNGKKIRAWCEEMKIKQKFVAVAHPQANGQVESTNRTIVNCLKKRIDELGRSWVDEIPLVLWSYRTTARAATRETPFRLTYGTEAVISVEVAMDTLRITTFDNEKNDDALRVQLNEVFDLREASYLHMERSKNLIKARKWSLKTFKEKLACTVIKDITNEQVLETPITETDMDRSLLSGNCEEQEVSENEPRDYDDEENDDSEAINELHDSESESVDADDENDDELDRDAPATTSPIEQSSGNKKRKYVAEHNGDLLTHNTILEARLACALQEAKARQTKATNVSEHNKELEHRIKTSTDPQLATELEVLQARLEYELEKSADLSEQIRKLTDAN
ncbi:PREDICTED: uncharacterized protein LOC105973192 [Erythranthe guttata]|uniref:uncharacterized protein LOC105973192 n=1 Tax=Erythranthe guttata TaxID=4155 RepID=UPI00064DA34C|nr:PREDICTED: uncharacterized protein LOC105973192 [Erythranthe guttata]|eukprot:XP_012853665.1 PREDICTED: uncharacterized protein LOC105973192 [Erythranthe guttata]